MLDVERSTRCGYFTKINKHIRPILGDLAPGALQRAREYPSGTPCIPLASNSIRAIHFILSGAFQRAVKWRWLDTNPIEHADPPAMPHPNPKPPSSTEAAQLVQEAWTHDPDWGTFV